MTKWLAVTFRRIFAAVLALLQTVLGLTGLRVDLSGVKTADSEISYSFTYATEKTYKKDFIADNSDFTIRLAKNEREACQLILHNTGKEEKKVHIEISEFKNGDASLPCSLFEVRYIPYNISLISKVEYPDALVPYYGAELLIEPHENLPIYIEVRSDKDTPAGSYSASVSIFDGDKKLETNAAVTADVWDFTLPDKPSCETAFGAYSNSLFNLNGVVDTTSGGNGITGKPNADKLYKQYYDFLLDRKISSYRLPYGMLSKEAEEYMSDERVTSFTIPYSENDEALQRIYEHVTENEEWASKAYYYPIDEPQDPEAYERYEQITERLGRLCPGYHMVTPFNVANVTINGKIQSSVALQDGKSDIMCPVSDVFASRSVRAKMAERAKNGDKAWWYVCCRPVGDYCNLHMCNDGLCPRILLWQQKSYDITGLLYWSTVFWDRCGNPWTNAKTWNSTAPGDGSLVYPGRYIGIDAPIASIRLETLTNGIEDYEYLTIAEKLLGRDYVDSVISKVTKGLTVYTSSDKLFDSVRAQLGNAVEEASE
ncbi:MAG: DUF4091 domain-containing protein [Clostridiales bacterium]|nr:DUF4091 domain-containing protein [Clostridiales bacterium]